MSEAETTQNTPSWRENVDWDTYSAVWERLNHPFLSQALQRLPIFTRPDPFIHVPGAGPARELAQLCKLYPKARYITSDITTDVIPAVQASHSSLDVTPRFLVEDAEHPAVDEVDLCVNVFMLHLMDDPPATLEALWKTLRPGGWMASLYFPPVPTGDGPLAGFFWAVSDILAGKVKPNWEQVALPWLMGRASRLTSSAIYARWAFSSLDEFRDALELLPQIQALRGKLGEDRYETIWERWREQPGLYPDQSKGWHGDAAARFLLAQKSGQQQV